MIIPRLVLHAGGSGIIFYGYSSLKRLQVYMEMEAQYGGFWQYLTIQGYVVCAIGGRMLIPAGRICLAGLTMVVSLVRDLFPSASSKQFSLYRIT